MFNEDLEKRSEEVRSKSQFTELRQIIDKAKNQSHGWKNLLSNIDSNEIVNRKSPPEVYEILVKKLPYKETRNYLKKVTSRMKDYSG